MVRAWSLNLQYYTVRGRKSTFSLRKLKQSILKRISFRTTEYLSDNHLSIDQLASLIKETSSQIQEFLGTVKIANFEGYAYCLEVIMVVSTDGEVDKSNALITRVFYRNLKDLVRDRGKLVTDSSWVRKAIDVATAM
jgi:hypothetical protein